ncbi:MAG: proline--tRNA ligase [Deltaproteobacteria bacterium]|nr:proline--tRNA ligase [Deltaproteobacteria bacterium]
MKVSNLVGKTLREDPKDAKLVSHRFLLRGAYIRQVSTGIYSLLPIAKRIASKIERIIRQEMDRIDGQEILLPVVMPRELWEEAGRYQSIGQEMLRFKDRNDMDMLLGMTHEEPVVMLARSEINSYRQLPCMLYQIQTKFRDEARSRGGLIRVREFTMKDAYSFHTDTSDMEKYYNRVHEAYSKIFSRCGLEKFIDVESDTGMMGGGLSHEFMELSENGEDTLFICDKCDYRANKEVAGSIIEYIREEEKNLEKVATPEKKTIEEVSEFLGVKTSQTAKAVFYNHDEKGFIFILIRGDIDVNETKLLKILGPGELRPAHEDEIKEIGSVPGYASTIGLNSEKFILLVDQSVSDSSNLVCGANEEGFHFKNFNYHRDSAPGTVVDISTPREGDGCTQCDGKLQIKRGIEIGNIFQLGTKYSEPMNCNYLDRDGKTRPAIMGCYGIGVGRLLASVMEEKYDDYGPLWPVSIAPWHVQICSLDQKKEIVREVSERIYGELMARGIEVLWDDRNEKAGVQFADADLRGIPFRIIISPRNLKNGNVEWKKRGDSSSEMVGTDDIVDWTEKLVKEELKKYDLA